MHWVKKSNLKTKNIKEKYWDKILKKNQEYRKKKNFNKKIKKKVEQKLKKNQENIFIKNLN